MTTLTPLEARCSVCLDTGSKSQDMGGDLDCTSCDAPQQRIRLRRHLEGKLYENMAWESYLFAQRQAAPVAAQPVEVASIKPWWADAQLLKHAELYRNLRMGTVILDPFSYKQISGALLDHVITERILKNSPDGKLPWENVAAPQPAAKPSDDVATAEAKLLIFAKLFAKENIEGDALHEDDSVAPELVEASDERYNKFKRQLSDAYLEYRAAMAKEKA